LSRISDISSREEFIIEMQREALRDQRRRRYRSMMFAVALLVLIVGLETNMPSLISIALRSL
jgi:hypothetical protein